MSDDTTIEPGVPAPKFYKIYKGLQTPTARIGEDPGGRFVRGSVEV